MTTYASDGSTQTSPEIDFDSPAPGHTVVTVESTPHEPEAAEPEVDVVDPEIVDADTLPALRDTPDPTASPGQWVHPEGWKYDWVEFKGDKLAIRVPKGAALVGLEFAKYHGEEAQQRVFGRFISRHVSDETFDRILDRMGNPDDEEYTTDTLGELAGVLGTIAGERLAKDAKALEEAKNGQARKGNS